MGTKTWNSLLNQPGEGLNKALCVDKKKQLYEEYLFQKVTLAAFISQFSQSLLSFLSYSTFWFPLWANPSSS